MSWVKMALKYEGKCIVCNQMIKKNEMGFWSKGIGVKHEKCAEKNEDLKCIICGSPVGCPNCEFIEDCNPQTVSPLCICKKCEQLEDLFISYKKAVVEKFPVLNIKI
uniref:Uncharacterized protein n=1 Tax=uncultured marine thaumarchaeote KM3_01_C08 TaxID=1455951 RepID=A0A075G709_9ARCH|nr:hypothetical protein [uncultured marine thaumarchaeote KM3_01_C08]